jgi:hypothetical protein
MISYQGWENRRALLGVLAGNVKQLQEIPNLNEDLLLKI